MLNRLIPFALLLLCGCSREPPPDPNVERLAQLTVRLERAADRLAEPRVIIVKFADPPERQAGGGTSRLTLRNP